MYRIFSLVSCVAFGLTASVFTAQGATLTFDGVSGDTAYFCDGPGDAGYSTREKGFKISNCPSSFVAPGEIHLDDSGTDFSSYVEFSSRKRFKAKSVEILALGTDFFDFESEALVPYDNVLFEGYRRGRLVAVQTFSTFGLDPLSTVLVDFGRRFRALTSLRITNILPGADDFARYPEAFCVDAPCGHISLNEITLRKNGRGGGYGQQPPVSAIPLPAGLPLLGASLGLLGFFGWRRRRATA